MNLLLDYMVHTVRTKKIEILSDIDSDIPPEVLGDSERLTQILVNLISNSIKFTSEGYIKIKAWSQNPKENETGRLIYFNITDTGIGIAEENVPKLFHAFKQLDSTHTKKYGGTGLGLVICKKLAQLMSGDICLKESKLGKGSTFEFYIKVADTAGELSLKKIDVSYLKDKRILLVDDESSNLTTLAAYMIDWGVTPLMAQSGESALTYIRKQFKFDLAILDIKMPKMNGIELATKMKEQYKITYPILALSSIGIHPEGSAIFDDIAEKPITREKLYRMIIKNLYNLSNSTKKRVTTIPVNNTSLLVAEDNVDNQKVIVGMLKKLGYVNVDVVDDGDKVLQKIKIKKYDVLLLDIKMPNMSGLDVATYINKHYPPNQKPIIIALTAVASYGGKDFYVKEGGMDDYISKPIMMDDLRNTLNKYTL